MTSVMVVPLDFKSKDKVKNVSINLILNTSRTQRKSEDATSMTSAGQKSPITPPPKLPPIDKSMFPRTLQPISKTNASHVSLPTQTATVPIRKSKADFTSKEELLGINEPMERASEEISWNPNDPSGSPDRINRQAQTVFMEPSGNYWYGIQPQSVYFDQNKQPVFVQNPHSEPHPIQMLPGQPVTVQQKPQAHQSQIPLISQAHYLPIGQVSGFPTISVSPGEHNNSLNSTYPHQAPARSSISQQGYVLSPPHFLLPGTVVKPETQSDSTTDTQKK
ncbi:uncharacterized protein KQ657_003237 [Scheffersomyces spartinae]|uniref:Uncharacterized protein n=1 Tax=Scheffersomyces spartinae TaxID=45513 RepID=A0A9P7VCS1_9ASCO|nr:uncharacterized protein KQ657_003237 [Scheffersomyces spartinae]KAG7195474.1 hypothetical protein KQ657_003237 [Scheffersomyces spartinae]